jgi:protein-tyrosine phosphatase
MRGANSHGARGKVKVANFMVALLFVCLGNICRSPLAQGVFERRAAEAGLVTRADSAGTGGWHIGASPDPRSSAAALAHGFDIRNQRGRQLSSQDFYEFDYIIVMDSQNLRDCLALKPAGAPAKLARLMEYADGGDVPDPYYGTAADFEAVLALIETGCAGLIKAIQ